MGMQVQLIFNPTLRIKRRIVQQNPQYWLQILMHNLINPRMQAAIQILLLLPCWWVINLLFLGKQAIFLTAGILVSSTEEASLRLKKARCVRFHAQIMTIFWVLCRLDRGNKEAIILTVNCYMNPQLEDWSIRCCFSDFRRGRHW